MSLPTRSLIFSLFLVLILNAAWAGLPSPPVKAGHAMIVSASRLADEAGLAVLKRGGNAVDAAVAVGFTLAVVYPEAGNIGGGGFMIYKKAGGAPTAIDFREKAPKSATRSMYLDAAGKVTGETVTGHRASGVPGTVAGLLRALDEFGTMRRDEVLAAAIRLAEKGFVVDSPVADDFAEYRDSLRLFASTRAVFFPGDKALTAGDTLRQPDLARTLRRIAKDGAKEFYEGETAGMIADEMRRGHGEITLEDLKAYATVRRAPVTGTYRGYQIVSMPPPSSGGACLLALLNFVEPSDLAKLGFHSEKSAHIMAEAMKRVFADRSEYLGDPDNQRIPLQTLISKGYAKSRLQEFDPVRATASAGIHPGTLPAHEKNHTTNYVVQDRKGNVVSVTYTLNDLFGSKVVVKGAGFLLNDQMDDFSAKPGVANMYGLVGGSANAIGPEKRPLSSMTPTLVLKNGVPVLVLGARGGSKIITAVFQTIVNVIDYKMSVDEAVRAPRLHHQWLPDTLYYEPGCFPNSVVQSMTAHGNVMLETTYSLGEVEALSFDPRRRAITGGPDDREPGTALGY